MKIPRRNQLDKCTSAELAIFNAMQENVKGWCNNFKGFIPYRYLIENEK